MDLENTGNILILGSLLSTLPLIIKSKVVEIGENVHYLLI
jgi:hypothetical protein